MKRILLPATLLLWSSVASAQYVSEEMALDKAAQWLRPMAQARGEQQAPGLTLAHTARVGETACYYAFDVADGQGFVMVAADEMAADILGYCDHGSFDPDHMPDNVRYWMDGYAQQIGRMIALREQLGDGEAWGHSAVLKAPARTTAIAPLLGDIEWGQGAPYNLAIDGGAGYFLTGCVATATGQIMKYHEWPMQDHGIRYDALPLEQVDGNMMYAPAIRSDYSYHWEDINPTYPSGRQWKLSDYEVKDMANLLYRFGRTVEMEYGTSSSGAHSYMVGQSLPKHFEYDAGLIYHLRSLMSDEDWEALVYDELAEERPVFYSGVDQRDESGHAFVCDGYDGNGHYHINWGWSGSYNGYYRLTSTPAEPALTPSGSGDGVNVNNPSFTDNQRLVAGIQPDCGGKPQVRLCSEYMVAEAESVPMNESVVVTGKFESLTLVDILPEIGLRFIDVKDRWKVFETGSSYSLLKPMYYYSKVSGYWPLGIEEGHTYDVEPIYRNSAREWVPVERHPDTKLPRVKATKATGLRVSAVEELPSRGYTTLDDMEIRFTVSNNTGSTKSNALMVLFYTEQFGQPLDYAVVSVQGLANNENREYVVSKNDLRAGNMLQEGTTYLYCFYNSDTEEWMSNNYRITFCNKKTVSLSLNDGDWGTLCLPFDAELPEGMEAYTVTGVRNDAIQVEEEMMLEMNRPYLVKGKQGQRYEFKGPDTPGGTYTNGVLESSTTGSSQTAPVGAYVLKKNSRGEMGFVKVKSAYSEYVRNYTAMMKLKGLHADFISLDTSLGIETVACDYDASAIATDAYRVDGTPAGADGKGLVIRHGKVEWRP